MNNESALPKCCEDHVTRPGVLSPTACEGCGRPLAVRDGRWQVENLTPDSSDGALTVRPEVLDTFSERRPVDRLNRTIPRRLGVFGFLRAIPGLWAQFKRIPGEFWAMDVDDDGYSVARVACPCREEPCVEVGTIEICVCERTFLFTGTGVYVANSPKDRQPEIPRWQRIARAL